MSMILKSIVAAAAALIAFGAMAQSQSHGVLDSAAKQLADNVSPRPAAVVVDLSPYAPTILLGCGRAHQERVTFESFDSEATASTLRRMGWRSETLCVENSGDKLNGLKLREVEVRLTASGVQEPRVGLVNRYDVYVQGSRVGSAERFMETRAIALGINNYGAGWVALTASKYPQLTKLANASFDHPIVVNAPRLERRKAYSVGAKFSGGVKSYVISRLTSEQLDHLDNVLATMSAEQRDIVDQAIDIGAK
jgi:hypothetical protein